MPTRDLIRKVVVRKEGKVLKAKKKTTLQYVVRTYIHAHTIDTNTITTYINTYVYGTNAEKSVNGDSRTCTSTGTEKFSQPTLTSSAEKRERLTRDGNRRAQPQSVI